MWRRCEKSPRAITDREGADRFGQDDLRLSSGCFVGRDAHSNPDAQPPFFLNAIGEYLLFEVSAKDESGKPVAELRGLYCTNCHNALAQALYRADDLVDPARQTGKTLRNQPLASVVKALAGGDARRFTTWFASRDVGACARAPPGHLPARPRPVCASVLGFRDSGAAPGSPCRIRDPDHVAAQACGRLARRAARFVRARP